MTYKYYTGMARSFLARRRYVFDRHRIVLVEGNYLLCKFDEWAEIEHLVDERWFVDVDIDISMQRVLKRHIATGIIHYLLCLLIV